MSELEFFAVWLLLGVPVAALAVFDYLKDRLRYCKEIDFGDVGTSTLLAILCVMAGPIGLIMIGIGWIANASFWNAVIYRRE